MKYQSMVLFNGDVTDIIPFEATRFKRITRNVKAKVKIKINVFTLPNIMYDMGEFIKSENDVKGTFAFDGGSYFYVHGNDKFVDKAVQLANVYGNQVIKQE